jgi:hypothetical protein
VRLTLDVVQPVAAGPEATAYPEGRAEGKPDGITIFVPSGEAVGSHAEVSRETSFRADGIGVRWRSSCDAEVTAGDAVGLSPGGR